MKKIELLDNETFTIKGVYGETYVFDGETLFVDSSAISRKAVVLKSLRTERGAEEWLRTAGRAYSGAQVFDTETLKSFEGRVVTLKSMASGDEDEEFDATLPFHVVSTEGGDDDEHDGDEYEGEKDASDMEPGEVEELMEDEEQEQEMTESQIAQVLHDAKKLYNMISEEEHLEPWMQAKLVKVAEYMSAIAENLEHDEGDIPDDSVVEEFEGNVGKDDDDDEDSMPSLPPLPPVFSPKEALTSDDDDEKKAVPVDAAMLAASYSEKSVVGQVFKSLHAARQWNRFENPDKDRYYIDIMREKDARKGFSKSTGLNAKYVVRDKWADEEVAIKGSYGNRVAKGKETRVAPIANIPQDVKQVSGLAYSHKTVTESNSLPANSVPLQTAPNAKIDDAARDDYGMVHPSAGQDGSSSDMPATNITVKDPPVASMDSKAKQVSALTNTYAQVREPNSRPANTGEQPTAPEAQIDADVRTVSAIRD